MKTLVRGTEVSNELIYMNIDVVNNGVFDKGSNQDPPCNYQESRGTAILKDASLYNFSIVRFTLDGPNRNLPLFIPTISKGASFLTTFGWKTIYSITLVANINGTTFTNQQYVYWLPERTDLREPASPLAKQDISDPYWWCFSYDHWLNCVNKAFTQAMINIGTLVGYSPFTLAPIMSYDANTGLFTLSCDSNGFGDNLTNDLINIAGFPSNFQSPINADQRLAWSSQAPTSKNEKFFVFFNSNMYGLFANFSTLYLGDDLPVATDFGRDYLIQVDNSRVATYNPLRLNPAGTGTPTSVVTASTLSPSTFPKYLFVMEQEAGSTSTLWSPIASIVFCSTLLPTLPENVGAPLNLGGSDNAVNPSTTAFQPIITDIGLPLGNAQDWRQQITYTPTAEYRLTSMGTSPQEVRSLDVQIFWRSRLTNELIPLRLFNQSTVSMKILFRLRNGGQ